MSKSISSQLEEPIFHTVYMYFTVIKHDRNLRSWVKIMYCIKLEQKRRVFFIFLKCSQMSGVLNYRVIQGLGFVIHFMMGVHVMWHKTMTHSSSMFYTMIKRGFFYQSEHAQDSIHTTGLEIAANTVTFAT